MPRRSDSPVARTVLVWLTAALAVLVLTGTALAWWDARRDAVSDTQQRAVDIAQTVADAPSVQSAVLTDDPTRTLQPFTERLRRDTSTDFIVVMSPTGTRYTHTDPSLIGKTFRGSIREAAAGHVHTEQYTGSLGPSVRAVVPVKVDGSVVALVSVGIRTSTVDAAVWRALGGILVAAGVIGAAGVVGVVVLSRRLRRETHGLGAAEITRMYEYYDAVLHGVREGLVLIDADGRVSLHNDEARRLLDVDDVRGQECGALGLGPEVTTALRHGTRLADAVTPLAEHVLVVNAAPAEWDGRRVGSVLTIRDHTELQAVSSELDSVRSLAESLRSQAHESSNRLHTIVSLVEIGRTEEAVEFGTREIRLAQQLTDSVVTSVEEPVLAALLLGKSAQAAERGVQLEVDPASRVDTLPVSAHDAVTIVGNLVDNAIDAAQGTVDATVVVHLAAGPSHLDVTVEDNGPGVPEEEREQVFTRGWSTKRDDGADRGLGLAIVHRTVLRLGGTITIGESTSGGARFDVEIGEDA